MPDTRRCPKCGSPIPSGSPAGLCPKCLLGGGIDSQSEADPNLRPTRESPASGSSSFVPPSIEELAGHFPQLEFLDLLGKGGMGAVYKARQRGLDRLVAVKILPPEIGHDAAFAERFTREARALARLSHSHIVSVYDFGQTPAPLAPLGRGAGGEGSLFYIVMEYVDGVNLRQTIQAGGLSPADALAIVPQICDALQFAHDEGIVHRDIKPENILIDKKGRVKIADFGLAKLLGTDASDHSLTGAHQVMGTLRYMAPEQMQGSREVDHRADIYSLGVVFYELLTGELPMGKFAPPSKKVQVDVRLDEIVLRALEQEPEHRYQHASEVKTDVETISRSPQPSSEARIRPAKGVAAGPEAMAPSRTTARIADSIETTEPQRSTASRWAFAFHMLSCLAGIATVFLPWFEFRYRHRAGQLGTVPSTMLGFNVVHAILTFAILLTLAILSLATRSVGRQRRWPSIVSIAGGVAVLVVNFQLLLVSNPYDSMFPSHDQVVKLHFGEQFTEQYEVELIAYHIGPYIALASAIGLLVFGAVSLGAVSASKTAADVDAPRPVETPQEQRERQHARWGAVTAAALMFAVLIITAIAMWVTGSVWCLLALCVPAFIAPCLENLARRAGSVWVFFATAVLSLIGSLALIAYGVWLTESLWPLFAILAPFFGMGAGVAAWQGDEDTETGPVSLPDAGMPLTQTRFAVSDTSDVARQAIFHFSSLGYQLIDQRPDACVFQRGGKWGGLWETDIRKLHTILTVRTAPATSGTQWVSCDWSVRALGAWITRRDIRQLEAEGDGFKSLLGGAVTPELHGEKAATDPVSLPHSSAEPASELVSGDRLPAGISTIVEHEVRGALRWVAGDSVSPTQSPPFPGRLMTLLSLAGCLMLMVPWLDLHIAQDANVRQFWSNAELPGAFSRTLYGFEQWPGIATGVALGLLTLLLIMTPVSRPLTWQRASVMSVIAACAVLHTFLFKLELENGRFTIPIILNEYARPAGQSGASSGDWQIDGERRMEPVTQQGSVPLRSIEHQVTYREGFYGSLGLSMLLLVLSAVGVRHAVARGGEKGVNADQDTGTGPVALSQIRSQLKGPAIALMVYGLLLLFPAALCFTNGFDIADGNDATPAAMGFGMMALSFILLGLVGLIIRGAWHMLAVESYRAALLASFLGQPVGLWGLFVLSRPDVKSAFGEVSRLQPLGRPILIPMLATFNLVGAILLMLVCAMKEPAEFAKPMPRLWQVWEQVDAVLGFVMAAGMFAASIGLFLWKPWARKLTLGVCIFGLVSFVFDAPYLARSALPDVYAEIQQTVIAEGVDPDAQEFVTLFTVVVLCGGTMVAGLTWLIGQLVYFNRPRVVAAFESQGESESYGKFLDWLCTGVGAVAGVLSVFAPLVLWFVVLPWLLKGSSGEKPVDTSVTRPDSTQPKTGEQWFGNKGDEHVMFWGPDSPTVSDRLALQLGLDAAQREAMNQALGKFFREFKALEVQNTRHETDANGHQITTITAFGPQVPALAERFWSELDSVLDGRQLTLGRKTVGLGLGMFESIFNYQVEIWRLGQSNPWYHWKESYPGRVNVTPSSEIDPSSGPVLPEKFRRFWKESEPNDATDASIHGAAESGDAARVKQLLDAGASVNAKDADGQTLLMKAVAGGHRSLAITLILLGAELTEQDRHGLTALMIAAERRDRAFLSKLSELSQLSYEQDTQKRQEKLRAFPGVDRALIAGRDIDRQGLGLHDAELLKDERGENALMKAARAGDWECFNLLANQVDSLLARDKLGQTVLMHVVLGGHAEQSDWFGNDGWLTKPPYFGTAGTPNVFIGRMLIFELERSLSVLDNDNKSVVQLAESNGHTAVARVLRRHLEAIITNQTAEIAKGGDSVAKYYRLRGLAWQALGDKENAESEFKKAVME